MSGLSSLPRGSKRGFWLQEDQEVLREKNVDCREQRDIMQRAPVPSDKTVLRKADINSRVIRRELPSGLHLALAWCQEGLL